ncbi:MAG: HDOD domain-containing protein [Desulfuromonas sp.]|nr:HDOD domain-containing protein [Desulfuromonas sp.]
MHSQDSSIDSIRKIKHIPPPSGISREIIRVVANDQVDLTDVVSIINKCPAITARILRCANSAYFGQRAQISTVREAIIRVLGLKITCSLSLAMALSSPFGTSNQCPMFDTRRYWFNAVTTGIIAQDLSRYLALRCKPEPATAYTAGLIHNIGLQALVHIFPEQMNSVFAVKTVPLKQALLQEFGIDHHQTASVLATSWDLPEELTKSLADLEDATSGATENPLPELVVLSAQIADSLFLNSKSNVQEIKFNEQMISTEHVQKVVSGVVEQIDGLHEISQLITTAGI